MWFIIVVEENDGWVGRLVDGTPTRDAGGPKLGARQIWEELLQQQSSMRTAIEACNAEMREELFRDFRAGIAGKPRRRAPISFRPEFLPLGTWWDELQRLLPAAASAPAGMLVVGAGSYVQACEGLRRRFREIVTFPSHDELESWIAATIGPNSPHDAADAPADSRAGATIPTAVVVRGGPQNVASNTVPTHAGSSTTSASGEQGYPAWREGTTKRTGSDHANPRRISRWAAIGGALLATMASITAVLMLLPTARSADSALESSRVRGRMQQDTAKLPEGEATHDRGGATRADTDAPNVDASNDGITAARQEISRLREEVAALERKLAERSEVRDHESERLLPTDNRDPSRRSDGVPDPDAPVGGHRIDSMKFRTLRSTPVFVQADDGADIAALLSADSQVNAVAVRGDWIEIRSRTDRTGFIRMADVTAVRDGEACTSDPSAAGCDALSLSQMDATAQQPPSIVIDAIEENSRVRGRVLGVAADQVNTLKVLVYVKTDRWYIQPSERGNAGRSFADIEPDGTWQIATVKRRFVADLVAALLVHRDVTALAKLDDLAQIPSLAVTTEESRGRL